MAIMVQRHLYLSPSHRVKCKKRSGLSIALKEVSGREGSGSGSGPSRPLPAWRCSASSNVNKCISMSTLPWILAHFSNKSLQHLFPTASTFSPDAPICWKGYHPRMRFCLKRLCVAPSELSTLSNLSLHMPGTFAPLSSFDRSNVSVPQILSVQWACDGGILDERFCGIKGKLWNNAHFICQHIF